MLAKIQHKPLTMEFVQISKMFQQLFQILANRWNLQMSVHHDVQNGNKPEAHVTQVHRNWTSVSIVCLLRRELFWVFSMERYMFIVPVI